MLSVTRCVFLKFILIVGVRVTSKLRIVVVVFLGFIVILC